MHRHTPTEWRKEKKKNNCNASARSAAICALLCLCCSIRCHGERQVRCAFLFLWKIAQRVQLLVRVQIMCVSLCVCVSCLSGSGCAARCLLWALWLWLVACLLALQTTKKELSLFSCVSICLCVYVHVRAVLANTFCLLAHRSANFPSTWRRGWGEV